MDLHELERNWEAFGRQDPMWAIVTDDRFKGGKWDSDAFHLSGERDIEILRNATIHHGLSFEGASALGFGCGVGRLTQALRGYYTHATGLDIAPSMIDQATRSNRHGDACQYFVNESNDLSRFSDNSFDLVCSIIVLQHMRPELSSKYISEFVRILRPGGTLVFQIPSQPGLPAAATELMDAGRACHIEVVSPPERMLAGERAVIHTKVTNTGEMAWSADHTLRLGNHWLDESGRMLVRDDGRAVLPGEMPPGATADIALQVVVPTLPGRYQLELDMVEEMVTWFAGCGSTTARVPVVVPLVDSDRACRIKVIRPPKSMLPGERAVIRTKVMNTGEMTWSADHLLRLGNHWLDESGSTLVRDDGRAGLPSEVPPGATVDIALQVVAPTLPGRYALELDMVEEMVAWFAMCGSTTACLPVTVGSGLANRVASTLRRLRPTPAVGASADAVMEMYGIPRADVIDLLQAAGATFRATAPDGFAPGWESYLYFATK